MLCVSARLGVVDLLGLQRPEQREQPAGSAAPVRWGCDQSAGWRQIRRAGGERGAGTGAPASLLERLPLQREAPPLLTVFPPAKGMRRPGGQRETSPRPEQGYKLKFGNMHPPRMSVN